MNRRSKLISFLLTIVMILGVVSVLPEEVLADSDDQIVVKELTGKLDNCYARAIFEPEETSLYIFRCEAWYKGCENTRSNKVAMVTEHKTGKIVDYHETEFKRYELEAGKKYDITFYFPNYTPGDSEYTDFTVTVTRDYIFVKNSGTQYTVEYGSDLTIIPEVVSTEDNISYLWQDGSTDPSLLLKDINDMCFLKCEISVDTPEGKKTFNSNFYVVVNGGGYRLEGIDKSRTVYVPYGSDYTLKLVCDDPLPGETSFSWGVKVGEGGVEFSDEHSDTFTVKNITQKTYVTYNVHHDGYSEGGLVNLCPDNELSLSVKGVKEIVGDALFSFVYGDGKKANYLIVDPDKTTVIEAELKGKDLTDSSVTWFKENDYKIGEGFSIKVSPDDLRSYSYRTLRVCADDRYGNSVNVEFYLVPKEYEPFLSDHTTTIEVPYGDDATLTIDPAIVFPEWSVVWDKTNATGWSVANIIPDNDLASIVAKNITEETYYKYTMHHGELTHIYHRFKLVPVTPTPIPTVTPTSVPTVKPTVKPTAKPTAVSKPTGSVTTVPTPAVTSAVKPTVKPTSVSEPTSSVKPTVKVTTAPVTPVAKPTVKTEDPKASILSFVERIYTYVLDREPEAEGAAFWTDELYSFRRTGAEVGLGFIFSDEFINRNLSDEDFVTVLYRTFFGRDPEEEGFKFWTGALKDGSLDRMGVANGFVYSQEWADTCASYGIRSGGSIAPSVEIAPSDATLAFVERMYTTAMNRASDEEGKKFWANELSNFRFTGEQVGVMFFLSDEMQGFNLSNEEFVTLLYKTFMDREPEEGGFNFWVGYLNDGGSREGSVLGFTRSEEFVSKCIEARILPY